MREATMRWEPVSRNIADSDKMSARLKCLVLPHSLQPVHKFKTPHMTQRVRVVSSSSIFRYRSIVSQLLHECRPNSKIDKPPASHLALVSFENCLNAMVVGVLSWRCERPRSSQLISQRPYKSEMRFVFPGVKLGARQSYRERTSRCQGSW